MKTKCMSCGGSMKKMQKGGPIKKKPLLPAPKPKTGKDALKALYEHVTTFGGATKKDNPKQKNINIVKKLKETFSSTKKPMKKMELGGTTTKRIIKKSTGGMYGIPQENLGTSGQYGFAKKGGATKAAKFAALAPPYNKATFADKIVGAKKSAGSKKLPKAQKGGYTVTNADGSPMTTPEGYRPPSVPSYPDFKKLRKTNPTDPAFIQLALNPEKFDSKDVKKYGPKKPSKRMMREMSKDSESAPMQTTPYKKGGSTKALPKAQLGGILKLAIRATKPLAKTLKPVAKKIVSKSKTTATKKFNYPKDKVKSMFPRVAEDVKKFNSETNSQKLFERKTIKEQMKQWDKAAELKQQKKYPVLKNKN